MILVPSWVGAASCKSQQMFNCDLINFVPDPQNCAFCHTRVAFQDKQFFCSVIKLIGSLLWNKMNISHSVTGAQDYWHRFNENSDFHIQNICLSLETGLHKKN